MQKAYLVRIASSDQGSKGIFVTNGFNMRTIELPWRNNRKSISCIPPGIYTVRIRQSPKYGRVYHITEVKDRTYILAHNGNYAGDASKGYKTHSQGCIIVGKTHGKLGGQDAVLTSKSTLRLFMEHMNYEEFELTVIDPSIESATETIARCKAA